MSSRQIVIDGTKVRNINYYGNDIKTAYYYGELVFSKYFYSPYKIRLSSNKIPGKKSKLNPDYETWNNKYIDLKSKVSLAETALEEHLKQQPVLDKYTPEYKAWYDENERLKKIYSDLNEELTVLESQEPKPQYLENPAYTSWNEVYLKYLNDYNSTKAEYDNWRANNPEPDRYIENPEWIKWNENQQKLEEEYYNAQNEYADYAKQEPEKESPQWTSWNDEQKRLKAVVDEKTNAYNSWWYANQPEPSPTIIDPAWERWYEELQRLESEMNNALNDYNNATSTYNAYISTNQAIHNELTRLQGVVSTKEQEKNAQASITQNAWDDYTSAKGKQDDASQEANSWAGIIRGYGALPGDYGSYNLAIAQYDNTISTLNTRKATAEKAKSDAENAKRQAENSINNLEAEKSRIYDRYYSQYIDFNRPLAQAWDDYQEQVWNNDQIRKEISTLQQSISDNNSQINHWRSTTIPNLESDLRSTESAISAKEREISDAQSQGKPQSEIDRLKGELERLKDHKREVAGEIVKTNGSISRLEQQNITLQNEINTKETNLRAGEARANDLKNTYDRLYQQAKSDLDNAYNNDPQVQEANRQIGTLKSQISQLDSTIASSNSTIAQCNQGISEAESNKNGLINAWSNWETASNNYDKYKAQADQKYAVWQAENEKLSGKKAEVQAAKNAVSNYQVKVNESDRQLNDYKTDITVKQNIYNSAKSRYDIHKAQEPARSEIPNPEHARWKAEQTRLKNDVDNAFSNWESVYVNQPSYESNEWKSWEQSLKNLEVARNIAANAVASGKQNEPEEQIENPAYAPWAETNKAFVDLLLVYKKRLDSQLAIKPDKELLNPEWDKWNKKKTQLTSETTLAYNNWQEHNKLEPEEKYIKNQEWLDWDAKRLVLEKELADARNALSSHLAKQPSQYITSNCYYYQYTLSATRLESPLSGYSSSTVCNISSLIINSQTQAHLEDAESVDFPIGSYNETLSLDMRVNEVGKSITTTWASIDMEYTSATLVIGTKDSFYTTYTIDVNRDLIVSPIVFPH